MRTLAERQRLSGRGLQRGRGVRTGERQFTLDPASRTLSCGGRECRLTPAQASLMFLLLRAFPEPVLHEAIWVACEGMSLRRQPPQFVFWCTSYGAN